MDAKIHDLQHLTHGQAYDQTQTDEEIRDGDILLVRGGLAFLCGAWPTMLVGESDTFHRLAIGLVDLAALDGGKYEDAILAAEEYRADAWERQREAEALRDYTESDRAAAFNDRYQAWRSEY